MHVNKYAIYIYIYIRIELNILFIYAKYDSHNIANLQRTDKASNYCEKIYIMIHVIMYVVSFKIYD